MKPTPIQLRIESLHRINRPCGIRTVANASDLTPDAQRLIFTEGIGAAVVHRINFPKVKAGKVSRKASLEAKVRPLLSKEETEDVKQTVALALIATGAFESGKMTIGAWKVAFRASRGAECLRIDRRAKSGNEILSIDSLTPEEISYIAARENLPVLPTARRLIVIRKLRYMHAQIFAAHRADSSRKSQSRLRFALRFCRFIASHYKAGSGSLGLSEVTKGNDSSSFRHAHETFRKYLSEGEEILTAESLANIPAKVVREMRAFSEIPDNFAIAG